MGQATKPKPSQLYLILCQNNRQRGNRRKRKATIRGTFHQQISSFYPRKGSQRGCTEHPSMPTGRRGCDHTRHLLTNAPRRDRISWAHSWSSSCSWDRREIQRAFRFKWTGMKIDLWSTFSFNAQTLCYFETQSTLPSLPYSH